jgi:molecular chaperone GrpE
MEDQKENKENHIEDALENTSEADDDQGQTAEDQLKDQLLRTMAELENLRKRSARELEEAHKFAITGFCKNLLTIIDTLDRALGSVPEDARTEDGLLKTMYDGVELTRKEFDKVFEKFNVTAVNPKGAPFDPNVHQAVSEVVAEDVDPGNVVDVLQLGYTIEGRLLRPAMVTVAKAQ